MLLPVRAMMHCWFCGGRVVSLTSQEYRCEAEGVRWEMSENLVIYARDENPPQTRQDPITGKFLAREASTTEVMS